LGGVPACRRLSRPHWSYAPPSAFPLAGAITFLWRRSRLTEEFTCARLRPDLLPDRQPPCGWTPSRAPLERVRCNAGWAAPPPGSGGLAPDGPLLTVTTTSLYDGPPRGWPHLLAPGHCLCRSRLTVGFTRAATAWKAPSTESYLKARFPVASKPRSGVGWKRCWVHYN